MKSSDQPQDLFGQEHLDEDQIANFKNKLVYTSHHLMREQEHKSLMARALNARIKFFRTMQEAITDCVRLKSTIPLQQAFGSEWEQHFDGVSPLYSKFDEAKHG